VKTSLGNVFKLSLSFKSLNENLNQQKCVTEIRHAFYFFVNILILKAVF